MSINHLTDQEIALRLAHSLRAWRLSPRGAGMTQSELSRKSGVGLTPLKRFERTGGTTLLSLIAIFRGLDLLDGLENLVPDPATPSPLEILEAEKARLRQQERKRAPRRPKPTKPRSGGTTIESQS
jgi:hypothetical protein